MRPGHSAIRCRGERRNVAPIDCAAGCDFGVCCECVNQWLRDGAWCLACNARVVRAAAAPRDPGQITVGDALVIILLLWLIKYLFL